MAIVNVSGTVSRIFYNGKGAEITESFQVKDKTVQKRWTAWFETEHGLFDGQTVEVSGLHSDDVDEWTDRENNIRHSVKRSLNKAKVKTATNAPVVEEPWAASAPVNDETPF